MRRYAEVIGDPISHSKSPLIHKFWLDKCGIDADYRATRVHTADLPAYVAARQLDPLWNGCNVTLPHKIDIIALVDDPGQIRSNIGAMNTILRDGARLIGTNTDSAGFFAPLAEFGFDAADVVVIGSGGAAHAVLHALKCAKARSVTVMARNGLKGAALLSRFGLKGSVVPITDTPPRADLLVNTSSLGMAGQPSPDWDLSALPDASVVFDIVYMPLLTPLLAAAGARGLDTIDGLEMLVAQAAAAFELFFGVAAPREHDAELRALLLP